MKIPLSAPDITEAEIEAVVAVLRTPRLSLGPVSEQFEAAVAQYVSVPHAVAVSSGTAGLHLCFRALGIGEGDEVIVPSFAFIAAANAIRYERATPVFADIDPATLNIDPQRIEEAVTPRTRAILVVHNFGIPADIPIILQIAERHGLLVIEDACEAIGAEHRARKAGSVGHAGVFAFYPNKQITTGEGGMVVTRDESLARRIRALRNQGRYETDDWFQHTELGYNYRISEINCALGLAQMSRLEEILQKRAAVASAYDQHLSRYQALTLPPLSVPNGRVSWFVYVVRLNNSAAIERDAVMRGLAAAGIASGRYFAPIHLQPSYAAWRDSANLPVTEAEASRTIALPFFNNLEAGAIDTVCDTLGHLLSPHQSPSADLQPR
jgi:perosamine synthetase